MFFRLLYSFRNRTSRLLPVADDVLVIVVGIIALASMLSMSATVNDAPHTVQTNEAQIMSYASTILFIFGLNLSKIPLVIWLKRLQLTGVFKICYIAIGCAILACLLSLTTTIIFQCQLPKPWDVQSGQCTSSVRRASTLTRQELTSPVSVVDHHDCHRYCDRCVLDNSAYHRSHELRSPTAQRKPCRPYALPPDTVGISTGHCLTLINPLAA